MVASVPTTNRRRPRTMTTPLSPAAAAVLTAYNETYQSDRHAIAAALRAAADQCKIEWNYHPDYPETESVIVVSDILSIATELEAL